MRISDWSSDVCSSDLFDCLSITRNTRKPHSLRRFASRTIAFVALICQFHHQLSNCWAELAIDVFMRDGRILDSVMYQRGRKHVLCVIGRAWCRERVCQCEESAVGGG